MEDTIRRNKPKLIQWLSLNSTILLQYVQSEGIITTPEYRKLYSINDSTEAIIKLLDTITGKGEEVCRDFLKLLKSEHVNENAPELREWIINVDTSEPVQLKSEDVDPTGAGPCVTNSACDAAYNGFNFAASSLKSTSTNPVYQTPERKISSMKTGYRSIQDYQGFLKEHRSKLVQNVKNIEPILDDLKLHPESTAKVSAEKTNQEKMRKLLDFVNCESIALRLINALFRHEEGLMMELN